MKTIATTLLLVTVLAGCSGDDGSDQVATDPADPSPSVVVASVPAASGSVRTEGLVTVVDPGTGPVACFGPVDDSRPPRCSGPALLGWSWSDQLHEEADGTRFGSFALIGAWDGSALTVTDAVPAALYDAMFVDPPTLPTPTRALSAAGLAEVADEASSLPGAVAAAPDEAGHVLVDVAYDDGTIQSYADEAWGTGVVVVTPALVDATS